MKKLSLIIVDAINQERRRDNIDIQINEQHLLFVDEPYYAYVSLLNNAIEINLAYLFDTEPRQTLQHDSAALTYGEISGKFYKYRCEYTDKQNCIPPKAFANKFQDKRDDFRFKNNVKFFTRLLSEIYEYIMKEP